MNLYFELLLYGMCSNFIFSGIGEEIVTVTTLRRTSQAFCNLTAIVEKKQRRKTYTQKTLQNMTQSKKTCD